MWHPGGSLEVWGCAEDPQGLSPREGTTSVAREGAQIYIYSPLDPRQDFQAGEAGADGCAEACEGSFVKGIPKH